MQSCSFRMMELLCTQYGHELNVLDESVSKWYNDYGLIAASARFKKKEHETQNTYRAVYLPTKENKFACDTNAHMNGSAYKWIQNTNTRSFRSTNQRNTRNDDNVSNLSSSSSLSSSQSTVYRDLSEDRLPKKTQGQFGHRFYSH